MRRKKRKMKKKKAKGKRQTLNSSAKNLMFQEVDLEHYIKEKPTAEQKKKFADLAIDKITDRTLSGKDIDGKKFKRYSKKYAALKGVNPGDVDLFKKGTMLDSIGRRKSKEKKGTVFIQMKKGKETLKSYNHNKGDTLAKREFFGITDDEAKRLAKKVMKDKEEPRSTTLAELRQGLEILDEN